MVEAGADCLLRIRQDRTAVTCFAVVSCFHLLPCVQPPPQPSTGQITRVDDTCCKFQFTSHVI